MDAAAALASALGAAVLTGVSQYLAVVLPARRSGQAAQSANEIAQLQLDETRAENARRWSTTIDELCRSADRGQRRAGLRFLRATIREPGADPALRALLDELTQEHIGRTLEAAQQGMRDGESLELLPPREHESSEEADDDEPEIDQADS